MWPSVLIFVCVGLLLIGYAAISAVSARKSREWISVTGQVISCEIEELEVIGARYSLWRPCIHYSYEFEGHRKTSSKLALDNLSHRFEARGKAQKFLEKYPKDKILSVYLSSDGDAVLINDIDWPRKSHYLAIGLAGLIVLASGMAFALISQ